MSYFFLQNKVDPEHIALLVKNEWKLSYVTPLHHFRHTQLKSYSKHLAAFIVAEKQKGVAVEVGLEVGFKVTFTAVIGLAETDEDAETVFIQVSLNNSIQDYLYCAFYDTIVAKQLYRKLSFYNIFIYCRNLMYLTYGKI